jgi:hypothetical protein
VATSPSAYTKLEPSIWRSHEGAEPWTFSTESSAFTTTSDAASSGSGGSTERASVGSSPKNTSGIPDVFSDSRIDS